MTDANRATVDKAEDAEIQNETIDDLFEETGDKAEPPKGEKDSLNDDKSDNKSEDTKPQAESPSAKEESVPVKALTEERRKRQDAEKRAQELEEKLKQLDPEVEKVPDPITDPNGYAQHIEDKNNLAQLRARVSLSRDLMLDAKEDYAEKERVFVELAQKNPFLVHQMNSSPNPAKFAYQTAVDHLETEKYRNPEYRQKYEQELEARIREKVLAELKQQEDKPAKKSALDVPDLTKATAAGANSDKGETLAELDDVLGDSPIDKGRRRK